MRAKRRAGEAPAPGAPSARSSWALAAAFLALYVLTWDRRSNFDALISAGALEAGPGGTELSKFLAWNHLLYNPAGWAVFRALAPLGLSGYQALQALNSAAAAAAVGLLHRFLREETGSEPWAAGWACLLGVSHVYWRGAAGGEAYAVGTLPLLACALESARWAARPEPRRLARASWLAAAAAALHTGNALAFGVVLAAVALSGEPWTRAAAPAAAAAALALPYAWAQGLVSLARARRWLAVASYSKTTYASTLAGSASWGFGPLAALRALRDSWLAPGAGLAAALAFAALVAGACAARPAAEPARRRRVSVLGAAFLLYAAFYSAWQAGNPVYWCAHAALLCAALGLAFGPEPGAPPARPRLAALGAAAALLALLSAGGAILPDRVAANFPAARFAEDVGRATPRASYVLISGGWSDLKVDLPAIAKRPRIALELYLMSYPRETVLSEIGKGLAQLTAAGVPLYALSELRAPENLAYLERNWGVTAADVDGLLAPYRLVPVRRFRVPDGTPPDQTLSLLWPRDAAAAERAAGYLYRARLGWEAELARRYSSAEPAGASRRATSPSVSRARRPKAS